jgi:hypothetical protein
MAMDSKAIWRVWYGKRLNIRRSFEDIGSFEGAVNFATFVEADRIEVVREVAAMPAGDIAA